MQEPTDEAAPPAMSEDEELVPAWFALLILVLIVAVVGVGGFIVRGMIVDRRATSPALADIRKWEAQVASDPGDVDARLSLAFAYQQDSQNERALSEYAKVLKQRPRDTAAMFNTGIIYMTLGQTKKGEDALWGVLAIDPKNALAAKELGTYYAAKGHYRSVIVAVRPVVQADPALADLQYLMGLSYEKLGKTDWARERYRLALRYSPDLKEAADALRRLGGSAP